ncbi:MAG: 4-phosphoerythronate dehydrogenase PdxB [Desulfobacterales bacterium]|nr:4-phosphoerythronate dehydrogenase PdxB [Desulfobacterales bacterium]
MKIVADDHIPFLRGVLEPFATVCYLPGAKIAREDIRDADALLTRTRTRCNGTLLEGSAVRFIGSATIGFDHIDTGFCADRGIHWCNAPGCNAGSVMQYVASALAHLSRKYNLDLAAMTLGIIGAGNVGTKIEKLAKILGMRVLLNDPPRARREGSIGFVSVDSIVREADIITLHVPLNRGGPDRTYHLWDHDFFSSLKKKPFLINTARGETVNTQALKEALTRKKVEGAVMDVWENEPQIDLGLLHRTEIGTPHIAGYSLDGKANGTSMVVRALSRFFNLGLDQWRPDHMPAPEKPVIENIPSGAAEQIILACVEATYDVESDSRRLRQSPETFEEQREHYPLRREFPSYVVADPHAWEKAETQLEVLGFKKGVGDEVGYGRRNTPIQKA